MAEKKQIGDRINETRGTMVDEPNEPDFSTPESARRSLGFIAQGVFNGTIDAKKATAMVSVVREMNKAPEIIVAVTRLIMQLIKLQGNPEMIQSLAPLLGLLPSGLEGSLYKSEKGM